LYVVKQPDLLEEESQNVQKGTMIVECSALFCFFFYGSLLAVVLPSVALSSRLEWLAIASNVLVLLYQDYSLCSV
jgi:hypothetical protein